MNMQFLFMNSDVHVATTKKKGNNFPSLMFFTSRLYL